MKIDFVRLFNTKYIHLPSFFRKMRWRDTICNWTRILWFVTFSGQGNPDECRSIQTGEDRTSYEACRCGGSRFFRGKMVVDVCRCTLQKCQHQRTFLGDLSKCWWNAKKVETLPEVEQRVYPPFGKGTSSKPSIFQGRGVIWRGLVSKAFSVETRFSGKVQPMWRPGETDWHLLDEGNSWWWWWWWWWWWLMVDGWWLMADGW